MTRLDLDNAFDTLPTVRHAPTSSGLAAGSPFLLIQLLQHHVDLHTGWICGVGLAGLLC